MHGLEEEYWGRVDFIYLDVDNSSNYPVMRQRFQNANSIPRFYILAPDGTLLYQWVGMESRDNMRGMLNWTAQNYPPQATVSQIQQMQLLNRLLGRALRVLQVAVR